MGFVRVMSVSELPAGQMRAVKAGQTEILLVHLETGFAAVQSKCPHAGAPLEKGAICNGRLVCPWHLGTFTLLSGELLEPPAMESLMTYAVRVEGENVMVDPEPIPPVKAPSKQTSETPVFLLVGTGAAGTMAAVTLRQRGFGGKMVAIDPVPDEPVDRTQLSKDALGGKMPLDQVAMDILTRIDVDRVTDSVVRLNSETKEVQLNSGAVINFDKALVATGGRPKRLDKSAHTIRHPQDVREILRKLEGKKSVVIVGTSFIGLEAASALVQRGLAVTVVGRETLPFAKQFGERVAQSLKALHERNGVKFSNASKSKNDVTIMGVGVDPELSFEHDLPCAEQGGGIQTDASLRAATDVWVAGDIASVNGTRIEHWRVAQQHGRVAASAMMGETATYEGVPFFWTYHFGKRLGYLGHAQDWDEIIFKGDVEALDFIALYVKDNRVQAALNCEFESQMAALSELMRTKLEREEALDAIALPAGPPSPI